MLLENWRQQKVILRLTDLYRIRENMWWVRYRSSDLALLDGVVTQMKNDDPKEIKEAYKYAFRDPGKSCMPKRGLSL